MNDRFVFNEPETIVEAKARKRRLEADIADIGRQLSLRNRKAKGRMMPADEYLHWRARTRNVLVCKETEQRFLKDWIIERRRRLVSAKLDIEDADDPLDVLVAVRTELARPQPRLGLLAEAIEQFLNHAA